MGMTRACGFFVLGFSFSLVHWWQRGHFHEMPLRLRSCKTLDWWQNRSFRQMTPRLFSSTDQFLAVKSHFVSLPPIKIFHFTGPLVAKGPFHRIATKKFFSKEDSNGGRMLKSLNAINTSTITSFVIGGKNAFSLKCHQDFLFHLFNP